MSFISLYWGLMNFIVYLLPLYVFMLDRILADKLRYEYILGKIFNRNIILPLSLIICSLFLYGRIWMYNTPLFIMFYIFIFLIIFYKLSIPLGEWKSLVIATLSVFAVAEIWELPIIINNIIMFSFSNKIKIIILSSLKLLSIIMIFYYTKRLKWHNNNLMKFMSWIVIITLAFFTVKYSSITFISSLYIRVIVAIWMITLILGFNRSKGGG